MVASLKRPSAAVEACSLPYLKPIVAGAADTPKNPKRVGRWLAAACSAVNVLAGVAAFHLSQVPKVSAPVAVEQAKMNLYEKVATPEYLVFVEQYQRDRTAALLNEAEKKEQRAQAAYQDAEAAKKSARNLEITASYKLADGLLGTAPGKPIKTTTHVRVSCSESPFGWTAAVTQVKELYQDGEITHLESCNAGSLFPGDVIGIAGEYQPAIRNES